jgi:hypothetical protein
VLGRGRRRTDGDTLHFGVGILDREVVEREHAMEGFGEELYLPLLINGRVQCSWASTNHYVTAYQYHKSDIVRGIGAL